MSIQPDELPREAKASHAGFGRAVQLNAVQHAAQIAELTRQINERDEDIRDAKRWRALMSAGRLRFLGSAGFDHDSAISVDRTIATAKQTGGLHFGVEVWDTYGKPDEYDHTSQNLHMASVFTAFADELIRRAAE